MNIPEFETERLLLRQVRPMDLPSYRRHFVDYEVIRFLSGQVPWPYPDDGVESYLESFMAEDEKPDRFMRGLFLKSNPNELIGAVEFWSPGTPENRGFWLGKEFWGQGLMTEAVQPITAYAFQELGFEKLVFANAVQNIGSHRVKEKSGATLVEVKPAKFVDPAFTEHEVWELTKENWLKNKT